MRFLTLIIQFVINIDLYDKASLFFISVEVVNFVALCSSFVKSLKIPVICFPRNIKNYKKYCDEISKFIKINDTKIIFEPGRSIIGNAGYLLTKIIYIKQTDKINFIIVDAGMNDLIRPALYNAFHKIIPTRRSGNIISKRHDFVGPICETTDKFLSLKSYQKLNEGDYIVICDVGAYGRVLSSNYNLRESSKEILIKNSKVLKIRKKEKLQDLI